jgi:hypothetical protein
MTTNAIAQLSDEELIEATVRAAAEERHATVDLIRLLMEVDDRRLDLSRGYASMFTYCTGALRLSESAAYKRITAARISRRIPTLIDEIEAGVLTLSAVRLLAPHLGADSDALIEGARGKSTREVENLISALHPQPDSQASARALPNRQLVSSPAARMSFHRGLRGERRIVAASDRTTRSLTTAQAQDFDSSCRRAVCRLGG